MPSDRFRIVVAAAIAALVSGGVRPHAQNPVVAAPSDLLIKFKNGATDAHRAAALARASARMRAHFAQVGIDRVEIPARSDVMRAIALLQADAAVLYVQPNYVRQITAVPADTSD